MSCKVVARRVLLLIAVLTLPLALMGAPAHAAPKGELVATTHSNGVSYAPKCGEYTVKFFNASTGVILEARVLIDVVVDFDTGNRVPYRGSPKRSWVVFKTFMKPGDTTYGTMDLCSTVKLTGEERDYTSFDVGKVRWKWA